MGKQKAVTMGELLKCLNPNDVVREIIVLDILKKLDDGGFQVTRKDGE